MDETNSTAVLDSLSPFNHAILQGNDQNTTRQKGYRAGAVYFDGFSNSIHLDVNNTDYLEESFDGRSVSLWLKADDGFYTGPKVKSYADLVGYYTFDSQSGNQVSDLSVNQSQGYLVNGPTIQTGQFGQSVSVDGGYQN
jgi:hypothetical protein